MLVIKQNRKSLYRLLPCNDHNCDLNRSRTNKEGRKEGRKGILFTKPACLFDVAVTATVMTVQNENPIVNSMIQIVLVNVNYE